MFIGVHGRLVIAGAGGRVDDAEVTGRRTRIALTFLVLERHRAVPHEELADAVWGDHPPPSWPSSLREVLTRTRRLLAVAGFTQAVSSRNRHLYVTLPDGLVVDVEQALAASDALRRGVEDLAEASRLAATVQAATATELLPGEDSRWMTAWRHKLLAARLTALEALATALLQAGQADRAIDAAAAVVEAAPLREPGHLAMMRALAASGRVVEALEVYRRCRDLLTTEVGIDPPAEMQALQAQLLRGDAGVGGPASRPVATVPARAMTRPPRARGDHLPLVGRHDVLGRLRERLQRQPDGGVDVVLVTGETGVGKTRLVTELMEVAVARGHSACYGSCEHGGWDDGDLVPLPIGDHPVLVGREPLDHWSVIDPVLPAAGDTPVVVIVDDVHRADAATTRFVERLARTPVEGKLTLVLTARSDEPTAALHALRAGLHRAGTPHEVELLPLTPRDIAVLGAGVLDRPLGADEVGRLAAAAGGVPLYLVMLLEAMRVHPGAGGPPPPAVVAAVEHRLGVLTPEARRLLEAGALAGSDFSPEVIAEVWDVVQPRAWLPVVEELLQRGLLVASSGDDLRLQFRHGVVAEVVRWGMSALRRSYISSRLLAIEVPPVAATLLPTHDPVARSPMRSAASAC